MTLLHRLVSIVRWMVGRNQAERDLNDELKAFVAMAAAERMRDGATPAEARRLAMLHLGGVEQSKELVRTARHGAWLDDLARDVRYSLRMCAHRPGPRPIRRCSQPRPWPQVKRGDTGRITLASGGLFTA